MPYALGHEHSFKWLTSSQNRKSSSLTVAASVAIEDKNGINACKLLGIAFTTAVGILLRSREKGLLDRNAALAKLAMLAKYGPYKNSIIEDARLKLEAGI